MSSKMYYSKDFNDALRYLQQELNLCEVVSKVLESANEQASKILNQKVELYNKEMF